jgi:hypothetical protein
MECPLRWLIVGGHVLFVLVVAAPVRAQHHHGPPPAAPADPGRSLFQSDMTLMAGMSPRDPMAGMAMPGWTGMTMGIVRLQFNDQGGPSGDEAVESTNWLMLMGQRDLLGGRLTLMGMTSLEPATLSGAGTPQLFQVGETFEGRPIVDRQHAHDLFMNLSATYRHPLGAEGAWWMQAALRGEPALGPTAFMHRASAGENPAAVLSHHFQDSTHITDDVLTLGAGWRWLSAEISAFHGEEPDEGRWDLDPGPLDSWSARVKLAQGRWSGHVSYGFLSDPEALEEGDVERTTASVHYNERGLGPLALSLVWGRNREDHGTFDGVLLEGAWQATPRDHLYARAEQADRDPHLLESKGLDEHEEEAAEAEDPVAVRAFTVGYLRDLVVLRDVPAFARVHLGVGADLTLYDVPTGLRQVYGSSPLSVHAFLRLRWGVPHGAGSAHVH